MVKDKLHCESDLDCAPAWHNSSGFSAICPLRLHLFSLATTACSFSLFIPHTNAIIARAWFMLGFVVFICYGSVRGCCTLMLHMLKMYLGFVGACDSVDVIAVNLHVLNLMLYPSFLDPCHRVICNKLATIAQCLAVFKNSCVRKQEKAIAHILWSRTADWKGDKWFSISPKLSFKISK